jgi:hypothetical protein
LKIPRINPFKPYTIAEANRGHWYKPVTAEVFIFVFTLGFVNALRHLKAEQSDGADERVSQHQDVASVCKTPNQYKELHQELQHSGST